MSAMLRRLIAVAVVIAGVAFPACAQRGGSRGGGGGFAHGGGFASHGVPAFRGNFAPMGRVGASSFFRSGGGVPTSYRYPGSTFARSSQSSRSSWRGGEPGGYNRREGFGGPYRYRHSYVSAYGGYALGGAGPDFLAYPDYFADDEHYDDSAQAAPPPPPMYPAGDADAARSSSSDLCRVSLSVRSINGRLKLRLQSLRLRTTSLWCSRTVALRRRSRITC